MTLTLQRVCCNFSDRQTLQHHGRHVLVDGRQVLSEPGQHDPYWVAVKELDRRPHDLPEHLVVQDGGAVNGHLEELMVPVLCGKQHHQEGKAEAGDDKQRVNLVRSVFWFVWI